MSYVLSGGLWRPRRSLCVFHLRFQRSTQLSRYASEFLYRAGIDGVTYIGDSSGVRNYMAFSDKDIRIDEHIRYQAEKNSLTSARSHAGLSPDFPDYRGLARDEQSLAGAALQYVKRLADNISSGNTSVKEPVSKILELLEGFDG